MIIESGLASQLNKITETRWAHLHRLHVTYDERANRFQVGRQGFLVAACFSGFQAVPLLGGAVHMVITAQRGGAPVEPVALLGMIVMGSSNLFIAYYSSVFYQESHLVQNWLDQLAKFERTHVSTQRGTFRASLASWGWSRLAMLTCKLVRFVTCRWAPLLFGVGPVLMAGFPLDLMNLYPARFVAPWLGLLREEWPIAGWLLEKTVTFGWNLVGTQIPGTYWAMLINLLGIGCVSLPSAIHATEQKLLTGQTDWDGFVVAHRQINMLADVMNRLFSTTLVIVLLGGLSLQIVPSFLMLGMPHLCNLTVVVLSLFILSQGVVAVSLVFGLCADVHHTSNKFMTRMEERVGRMRGFQARKCRRMLRSLRTVKVHFGAMNFIERLTPVVFQQFAVEQLVDCLLLNKA